MKKAISFLTIFSLLLTLLLIFAAESCANTPSRFVKGAEEDIAVFPQPGMVQAVRAEYSPDKKRIISGQGDGSVKIWDAESGRLIRSITPHTGPVWSVGWSNDSSMFLSCGLTDTLKVWNVKTFREIWSASGCDMSAVFSPDGKIVAASTKNGTVRLFNAATGRKIREITVQQEGHFHTLAICFSPDGKQFAVSEIAAGIGTIKIFNVTTGALITTLAEQVHEKGSKVHAGGAALAFSPDGKRLVFSEFGEKNVHIYDTISGKELFTLSGHEEAVNSAVFSPNGTYITTGSLDYSVKIWDSLSGKELNTYYNNFSISSVSFKDNRYVLAATTGSLVEIDAQSGEEVRSFGGKTFSYGSSFSPHGDIFSGKKVWFPDGSSPMELKSLTDLVTLAAAYSPDGKILAVLVRAKIDENTDMNKAPTAYIILIDIKSGNVTKKLSEFNFAGYSNINIIFGSDDNNFSMSQPYTPPLTFSTDGRRIASGSPDGYTFLWDIESGKLIWDRPLHKGAVTHIAFSTGGLIASCSTDGNLKIWNEQTLIAKTYPGFDDNGILNLAFNPDGKTIVASYSDKITLFDIQTCKEIWTAKENGGAFTLAYNPHKKHILIGSILGPRILNAETGDLIHKLSWEGSMDISKVAYSPDGKYFYINTMDGSWYTEMLAMLGEDAIGPLVGISPENSGHPINTRIPYTLGLYSYDPTSWAGFISYGITYGFGAYLARNYGGTALIREIAQNNKTNIDSISLALSVFNPSMDFTKAVERYYEAFICNDNRDRGTASFNKTVSNTINGCQYTLYGFDIYQINRVNIALSAGYISYWNTTEKGPYLYNLTQNYLLDWYSFILLSCADWQNVSGELIVDMKKPSSSSVNLHLIVR